LDINPGATSKDIGKYSSDNPPFYYRFDAQDEEQGSTFYNSFLYSLSLITTVGKIARKDDTF
jgi:hypothetical protein